MPSAATMMTLYTSDGTATMCSGAPCWMAMSTVAGPPRASPSRSPAMTAFRDVRPAEGSSCTSSLFLAKMPADCAAQYRTVLVEVPLMPKRTLSAAPVPLGLAAEAAPAAEPAGDCTAAGPACPAQPASRIAAARAVTQGYLMAVAHTIAQKPLAGTRRPAHPFG